MQTHFTKMSLAECDLAQSPFRASVDNDPLTAHLNILWKLNLEKSAMSANRSTDKSQSKMGINEFQDTVEAFDVVVFDIALNHG